MVNRWARETPDTFKFTAKFPQTVTHKKRLSDVESDLDYFYRAVTTLENKLLCLLLQLPPSMNKNEGMKKFQALPLDRRFRYAIEARHETWFDDEVYSCLKQNEICLVWSQLTELRSPTIVTTDFIYLRLIGDRSIDEMDFGTIQRDRIQEMEYWADEIKKARTNKNLKVGVVAANNHYAGFGPGTANLFRRMLDITETRLWDQLPYRDERQATLTDF